MKICIPTFTDEGLEDVPCAHFGSAPYFVLHDTETGDTRVIRNRNEHHEHGTCNPLHELDGEEVDAVLVGGIGRRAYARLHHAGIRVFQANRGTIRENLQEVCEGKLTEFTTDTACHGYEGGAAGHGVPSHTRSWNQPFVDRSACYPHLTAMKTIWLMTILTCSGIALADEDSNALTTTVKPESKVVQFTLTPIGHVEKQAGRTFVRLDERHRKGLLGLEKWSHIWVFYWFDRNDKPEKRAVLQVHPRGNRDNPLTGVFATRSPARPNLIALSLCRVISIKGGSIEIESIDAFDQTPVIDIKPYIQGIDRPKAKPHSPGWVDR